LPVKVLIPGIQRDGEETPLMPLEALFGAVFLPEGGRSTTFEDIDEFLEEMSLRIETFSRRDAADKGIVLVPAALQIDKGSVTSLSFPPFEGQGHDIFDKIPLEDIDTLTGGPMVIGCVQTLRVAVNPLE
jgi:hypothetical protein